MKNYLVKSLFEIESHDWHVLDRKHETDLYKKYLALHEISLESFERHLGGTWEFKFVTGKFKDISQAFEKTFWTIHDLWHQEPCNILYTDPDTLALKPVEIFDQFQHFMMFNHTDPRSFRGGGITIKDFFNAGVRYFPATMSQNTWDLGSLMAKQWNHSSYDTEQVILNAMLWTQGLTLQQAHHPELNWMAMNLRNLDPARISGHEAWNQMPIDQARIIHFHSSRGADAVKNIMELVKSSSLYQ